MTPRRSSVDQPSPPEWQAWLAVVSAEHVARGVRLGIAQTNHGSRAGLARMRAGDLLVHYSPHERLGERSPVRAFTAVGRLPDDTLWQADEGSFRPWRRRVDYAPDARRVSLEDLRERLELTAEPNWGYRLRRGLVPLARADALLIHEAMTGATLGTPIRSAADRRADGPPIGPSGRGTRLA